MPSGILLYDKVKNAVVKKNNKPETIKLVKNLYGTILEHRFLVCGVYLLSVRQHC